MSDATSGVKPDNAKRAFEASATKPKPLAVNPDGIPTDLRERDQWVCWNYQRRHGHWTKVPINPYTGANASCDDPSTWGRFGVAFDHYQSQRLDGIGYEFTENDPFCGIDLDDCRNPATGAITEWGTDIIATLDTYAEVSPSRTGVKAIVRATKPGNRCQKKYLTGKVEIYDKGRFFALTGHALPGVHGTVNDGQGQLDEVYFKVFGNPASPSQLSGQPETADAEDPEVAKSSGTRLMNYAALPLELRQQFERLLDDCRSPGDGDRSRADFNACCWAIRNGIGQEFAWEKLKNVGKTADRGWKYFDDTWENAEEEVRRNGTPPPAAKRAAEGPHLCDRPEVLALQCHRLANLTLRPENPRRTGSGKVTVLLCVLDSNGQCVRRLPVSDSLNSQQQTVKALKRLAPAADPEPVVGLILAEAAAAIDQQEAAGTQGPTIADIIAQQVPGRFKLVFPTDRGAYSETRGAELTVVDFSRYMPGWLVHECERANDCPSNRTALFKRMQGELQSLWSTIVEQLPTEDQANVGPTSPAARRFRYKLIEVITSPITFEVSKTLAGTSGEVVSARSSLVERIRTQAEDYLAGFIPPSPREFWRQSQRAFDCWWRPAKVRGKTTIMVALRYRLGFQTKIPLPGVFDQDSLRSQCLRSGVIAPNPRVRNRLTDGSRLVILSPAFVRELLAQPKEPRPKPPTATGGGPVACSPPGGQAQTGKPAAAV
jgi:hypothetical protein